MARLQTIHTFSIVPACSVWRCHPSLSLSLSIPALALESSVDSILHCLARVRVMRKRENERVSFTLHPRARSIRFHFGQGPGAGLLTTLYALD